LFNFPTVQYTTNFSFGTILTYVHKCVRTWVCTMVKVFKVGFVQKAILKPDMEVKNISTFQWVLFLPFADEDEEEEEKWLRDKTNGDLIETKDWILSF
jgi:hypothetical protein